MFNFWPTRQSCYTLLHYVTLRYVTGFVSFIELTFYSGGLSAVTPVFACEEHVVYKRSYIMSYMSTSVVITDGLGLPYFTYLHVLLVFLLDFEN
jgi:hypothetical protein